MSDILEIYFYADESGHLHWHSNDQYFVIGGFMCLKENSTIIKQHYKRMLKRIKIKRKMSSSEELKANMMTENEKIKLYNSFQYCNGFNGFAFVVDKNAMFKKIENENIFYNYFIKLIVEDVVKRKISYSFNDTTVMVNMRLDNRNTAVEHLKSLEDYLNAENSMNNYSFSVKYCDSKTDYCIQIADLIANTIYLSIHNSKLVSNLMKEVDTSRTLILGFPQNIRFK